MLLVKRSSLALFSEMVIYAVFDNMMPTESRKKHFEQPGSSNFCAQSLGEVQSTQQMFIALLYSSFSVPVHCKIL